MKRIIKLFIGAVVAALIIRLLSELFRPVQVRLEQQLAPAPPRRRPPPPLLMPSEPKPPPTRHDRVNLNTADAAALIALPGVGPSLAERIIVERDHKGSFSIIDELTDVPGIGTALMERLRPLVMV